jgi:hypothetical protein
MLKEKAFCFLISSRSAVILRKGFPTWTSKSVESFALWSISMP